MTRLQRLLAAPVALAAVLSVADRDAAGQPGELEVTLRVLDDATGVAAARITIPPEASTREPPAPPEEPAAESSDVPPPPTQ